MRDFILTLLDDNLGNITINLFDFWHIAYFLIIVGVTILLAVLLKNKSDKLKTTVINTYLIVATISYALDFIIVGLTRDNIAAIIDKFPFHVCTLLSILNCFANFNSKFKRLKKPAVILSVVTPLMYICYPGTALGGVSPISYKVTQTFLYHGCMFTYGCLSVAFNKIEVDIKKCYEELFLIIAIAIWAGLGNYMFNAPNGHHYDWFFLTGSTFPFIPTALMPLAVVTAIFLMVLIIYGIYYLVENIKKKKSKN